MTRKVPYVLPTAAHRLLCWAGVHLWMAVPEQYTEGDHRICLACGRLQDFSYMHGWKESGLPYDVLATVHWSGRGGEERK